ncbi:putative two-component system sensor kinase [Actinacidiphila reveromycinica]|uniref:Oxygen sensor histidine kinase NreB n=1 Tax=Actinacidiphila reveromycinica TaxID=659352 RepID=A0A7U3UPW8_9ACTN|nr:GAF domain-containing sensor histidine kinase [Streptomyces sp. SN-593]BBA96531.1 putative two-component system sensor kinase [Streptomyces sp. SN-593]
MSERTPRGGIEAVSAAIVAMNRRLEVREVLQTIVASARELLDAQYAALGVPDDHGGFAQFVVDGVGDEQWKAIGPLPRQHGVLAAMLREATPQRLADVRDFESFAGWPRAHPVMKDFIGMPVADGDDILGAIFLANKNTAAPAGRRAGTDPVGTDPARAGTGATCPAGFTQDDEDLLRILADHAAIALTNARLHERSRELTLAGERARIAHELHDAVSQKLFSLRLTAQASAALVDTDPGRAKEELRQVAALAAEAADELRAVVVELRPAALDEDGLVATLRTQTDVLDRVHSANVTFRAVRMRALPAPQEEALLRVAQEATHNALRHAHPRTVAVSLEGHGGGGATLRVRDDGRGFDPTAVRRAGRHLGLVSMRDRADGVGGALSVRSEPGRGTVIEMEVPGG